MSGLVWRMVDLMVLKRHFLLNQGWQRTTRMVTIPAHRGIITDRNGEVLAVSTPVSSIWANPHYFKASSLQQRDLGRCLQISLRKLKRHLKKKSRTFVYLKRNVTPLIEACVKNLKIQGIFTQKSFHRYYPHGAASAHVVGHTNVDDKGQEGIELAYDRWLTGKPGKKLVMKDRLGHTIGSLALLKAAKPGNVLMLSIDQRLQYLAFRYLGDALTKTHAKSGSVVILDAKTNEVLAMVNLPSYNPNHSPTFHDGRYRNRALTDVFEPGSTVKPFALASAFISGRYKPNSTVNTHPGELMVQGHRITDEGLNYGLISLKEVLQKSSNIGMSKVIMSLPASNLVNTLKYFGFGQSTRSGFPGEVSGTITYPKPNQSFVLATLSFGYGLSASLLQLTNAYGILARGGIDKPVRFIRYTQPSKSDSIKKTSSNTTGGTRVIPKEVAKQVLTILESVVQLGGTGYLAHVKGYRVAGKTGTAYMATLHGYDKQHYLASFFGIAPLSTPRFVVGVMINQPSIRHHYGGLIAAPTFSRIMGETLKLWNIKPDSL